MEGGTYYCAYPWDSTRMCKQALAVDRRAWTSCAQAARSLTPEQFKAAYEQFLASTRGTSDGGECRNRTGGVYALTTFASILPGPAEDELQAYLDALPLGRGAPARPAVAAAPVAHPHLRRARGPGPRPPRGEAGRAAAGVHVELRRRRWTATWTTIAEKVPEADEWWGRCVGLPGPRRQGAFRAYIRAHKVNTQLFANAYPGATVQDVRAALENRASAWSTFAVEAQGLDAAELQQRFLRGAGLMARTMPRLGRPANLPAQERPSSTSPTSRATSCAATRIPCAAYLFLRIDDPVRRPAR